MYSAKFKALVSIFCLLLVIATVPAPAAAQDGGELIGAFDVGPNGFPGAVPLFETAGRLWISKIYGTLIQWNADLTGLSPNLAESWESNEDNSVWTFHLREGVLFHDGEPMTAEDVKFSFELALDPVTASVFVAQSGINATLFEGGDAFANGEADEISGIRVIDDLTIEFALATPNPRFPVNTLYGWVLPKHALEGFDRATLQNNGWFYTDAIGTGPFMHEEYEQGQFWTLVANPNYWEGAPKLSRLINRYFADETAATLAFESGEIQFTYIGGDVAQRLSERDDLQIFSGPSGITNYMIFNYRNPLFQDIRVRQAFRYAIDRNAIAEAVLQGTAEPLTCLGAFSSMRPDASELNAYEYNPELARQLLAEAGWDSNQSIEVVTYYNNQFHNDAMVAMQAFLADVGINIVPLVQDVPTYNSYFYTGEGWDISYRGLANTPLNYPWGFYETGGYPEASGGTLMGASFEELDDLIARARAESDPATYESLIQDICKYQNENALEAYMWTAARYSVASGALEDFYHFPIPTGGPYEDHAELWTVGS